MCTSPITLNREVAGRLVTRVVPCGKCEECRAKLRNEVAALSALEGVGRDSLTFVTLTYRQETLPIAVSESVDGVRRIIGYQRGSDSPAWFLNFCKHKCTPGFWSGQFGLDYGLFDYCPSLFRDDWKHHMKRFRSECDRHSLSKDFAFMSFGEYGEKRHRPHLHALIFGFTPEHDERFKKLWENHFGECKLIRVPRFNADGSDAFMKVSKYISKYVSKGNHLPSFVLKGFADPPRRVSSVRFGRKNLDIPRLRSFI